MCPVISANKMYKYGTLGTEQGAAKGKENKLFIDYCKRFIRGNNVRVGYLSA